MNKRDLIFIHAPSVYDFRNRDDILFAFLSTGGTIAVSQIYEMYPLGLKALQTSLSNRGMKVEIINLANMMLKDPGMDVESFLSSLDAKMFGIDLHWLVHTQGALSVAKILKKLHPDIPVIFGGISASLVYKELIEYPQVDYVIRGAEASDTIEKLIGQLENRSFENIPNLCWKDKKGMISINEFQVTNAYNADIDWEYSDTEINYFITIPGAGCKYNCTSCGGSNYSMRKHFGIENGFVGKDLTTFLNELQTIKNFPGKSKRLVTLHHWFENIDTLKRVLDTIDGDGIQTIHYTVYNLLSLDHLKLISQYRVKPLFEISIESHDREVRRMSGKPPYSNEELESWLDSVFEHNKKASVEIYFMLGLPKQTPGIVMGDVDYAEHLLHKYAEHEINVFICPMVPFLINGSLIHDNPEKFGYKIFFDKLRDYEKALLVPHWKDSLNYESKWMSREELVDISYKACRRLVLAKEKTLKLPKVLSRSIIDKIDKTVELLHLIKEYDGTTLPQDVRRKILEYNNEILKSAPTQQSPFNFSVYKNWYE